MVPVASAELPDFVFLPRECAHDTNAGQVLLQRACKTPFRLVDLFESLTHLSKEHNREANDWRNQDQRNSRHAGIDGVHQRERDKKHQSGAADLDDLVEQELTDRFHVGCAALDQVARFRAVVVRTGKMLQLIV